MRRDVDPVVVVGTGAFATALTAALVRTARAPTEVVLVGRSPATGTRVAAELDSQRVRVRFHDGGAFATSDFSALFTTVRPRLVAVCASEQSPYHRSQYNPDWERVRAHAEFGFTAPLQATFAIRAAQALAALGQSDIPLVNACYPDLVNPLLRLLGLPVLCGLGNVASLTAALRELLPRRSGAPVRMAAHHRHLKQAPTAEMEARVWVGEGTLPDAHRLLDQVRRVPRRQLNDLGADQGGRLLARLLTGQTVRTNLPGVHGPGGYPVRITINGCALDLPDGVELAELAAWQQHHAHAEGVWVRPDGQLTFTGAAARGVIELGIAHTPSLPVTQWEQVRDRMIRVRQGLSLPSLPTAGEALC
jgi:hypothetical protein